MSYPKITLYLLPLIGGGLYALGFPTKPGFHLFFLPIIGFTLLLNAWNLLDKRRRAHLGQQLLSTISFCLGYTLLGYYWIPHTLSEFGGLYAPWNYILGILFSLVIAPQFYVFLILFYFIVSLQIKNFRFLQPLFSSHFLLALALTLCEYFTPQQFPAHIGHPWLQLSPYLGLAPIFGAPIFSFFSYWLCFSLYSFIKNQKIDYYAWIVSFIFLIINILFPLKSLSDQGDHKNGVRFVQANIGNVMKLSSEAGHVQSISEVYDRFYELSTKPYTKNDSQLDLIIWPETAYPHLLNSKVLKEDSNAIPALLKETAKQKNAGLFTGGYDTNESSMHSGFESEYNAAFYFDSSGKLKDVYHKKILIPFGEGLPFGPLNPYISQYVKNISYFARGQDFVTFKTQNDTPFISAICYEILFSSFIRQYLNSSSDGPHFIVNITNDSWYGDTAEPHQHLFLSQWRALEFQVPILRMTNTGITSVLYPNGSESERIGVFEKGILDVTLKTKDKAPSLFQKYGIWGTLLFIALLFSILLIIEKILIRFQLKSLLLKDHVSE